MSKFLKPALAACVISFVACLEVNAAPVMPQIQSAIPGLPVAPPVEETSPLVQEAQTYCYNRYSGRFLHWGSCRRRVVRTPGRTYCYNRRTGQFLHWGSCRR